MRDTTKALAIGFACFFLMWGVYHIIYVAEKKAQQDLKHYHFIMQQK